MELQQSNGLVVWLTGMKRAGKTTLASLVVQRLGLIGRTAVLLDEDGEAKLLLEGLGGGKDDHAAVVRRLGFVAKAVARGGGIAVCAALSPYRDAREALRREVRRFVEVFVDSKLESLMAREGKEGLYRRALAREIQGVAGVDLPYEPPSHAELVIHTDQEPVEACLTRIFQALVDGKYLAPAEFARLTGGLRPRRRPAKAARGGKGPARPSRPGAAKPAKPAKVARAARKAPARAAARTSGRRR